MVDTLDSRVEFKPKLGNVNEPDREKVDRSGVVILPTSAFNSVVKDMETLSVDRKKGHMPDFDKLEMPTLDNLQINILLQALTETFPQIYEETKDEKLTRDFYRRILGSYITCCIQKSFNEGYNDFTLDVRKAPLIQLCGLQGTINNTIRVNLEGDTHSEFGHGSKYASYVVNGFVSPQSLWKSDHCQIIVHGDTWLPIGTDSTDDVYILMGEVKDTHKLEQWRSNFKITPRYKEHGWPSRSIFRVKSPDGYLLLLEENAKHRDCGSRVEYFPEERIGK